MRVVNMADIQLEKRSSRSVNEESGEYIQLWQHDRILPFGCMTAKVTDLEQIEGIELGSISPRDPR